MNTLRSILKEMADLQNIKKLIQLVEKENSLLPYSEQDKQFISLQTAKKEFKKQYSRFYNRFDERKLDRLLELATSDEPEYRFLIIDNLTPGDTELKLKPRPRGYTLTSKGGILLIFANKWKNVVNIIVIIAIPIITFLIGLFSEEIKQLILKLI